MSKKLSQTNNNLWTAIIGVAGVIIGAALGYFGTQASAQAQIETAKINIYGPIYATQTAEAKITPVITAFASNNIDALAIEDIPQNVFVFAGNNGAWGAFSVIYDNELRLNYRLEYFLPDDIQDFAGITFQFPGGYNLSEYNAVKFTILFNEPTDEIDLLIKDIGDNENSIHITGNGDKQMDLRFEFANFPKINFNAVKEILFMAKSDFSPGSHDVQIKNVHFVK